MNKKRYIRTFLLMVVCAGIGFFYLYQRGMLETFSESRSFIAGEQSVQEFFEAASESVSTEKETGIFVYISGAVVSPGVYELSEDSRIFEVLELAGGFLENAQEDTVNLAEKVYDGQQIRIPFQGEDASASSDGRVNINTADKETLMTLKGIGESRAEAIITYRLEHGSFEKPEDIMEISGIGESLFQQIRSKIKV